MPELSPAQRGSGAKLAAGVTLRRRYRKADAGPPCDTCRLPLVTALAEAGETTHPTCEDDFPAMVRVLRRTLKTRAVAHATPAVGVNVDQPGRDLPTKAGHDPGSFPGRAGPAPTASTSAPYTITSPQRVKLHAMLPDAGITQRDRKLLLCSDVAGRPIGSTNELSQDEARRVIDMLEDMLAG